MRTHSSNVAVCVAAALLSTHLNFQEATALAPNSKLAGRFSALTGMANTPPLHKKLHALPSADEATSDDIEVATSIPTSTEIITDPQPVAGMPDLISSLQDTIGRIEEDRLVHPELQSGEVPRLFSSLKYETSVEGKVQSAHVQGSVAGAAALVAGTTIGAGVLALPSATAAAGFLPSTAAMGLAWLYMTVSGLLIAELTLNRIVASGRPGLGLLELYENSLGKNLGMVGSSAYFFLHYAIMVAYVAQGGSNISSFLEAAGLSGIAQISGAGQALFAGVCGVTLFLSDSKMVEKINNVLVVGVIASFTGIVGFGSTSADFGALLDPVAQHPEKVVSCFPILILALVYQNIVPTVVYELEGNRSKITQSIIAGTTIPFAMFLAFNGVVLGNALNAGMDLTSGVNPVSLLQGKAIGGLVGTFSMLAVITSLIGFTFGLLDAWTDVFNLPTKGKEFEKAKAPLYALIFTPPLVLSVLDPNIFYGALDYAGAFGVTTLFLVLPPYMVWQERYGEDQTPLATKPVGEYLFFLLQTICAVQISAHHKWSCHSSPWKGSARFHVHSGCSANNRAGARKGCIAGVPCAMIARVQFHPAGVHPVISLLAH